MLTCVEAWLQPLAPHQISFKRANDKTLLARKPHNSVESISVERIGHDNHEQIGDELAKSVQQWLDAEWMPQHVHAAMGLECKRSYVKCRQAGLVDLMDIMTATADDLTDNWRVMYDKESFVGVWDIVNYVSDFLIKKTGLEGCECSSKIY
jgi:hypothetical protein